jgi:hypothetical protein
MNIFKNLKIKKKKYGRRYDDKKIYFILKNYFFL